MIFLKAQRLSFFVDGAHYSRSCIDLQWRMFSMRILFYIKLYEQCSEASNHINFDEC